MEMGQLQWYLIKNDQDMAKVLWTRDEMLLALNLYLKMSFSKINKRRPEIIGLSQMIGRTPDAVAYRLVNFASYDSRLKQRGISGMSHGGKACEDFWNEFVANREQVLYESEQVLAKYQGVPLEKKYEKDLKNIPADIAGKTRISQIKVRVNQSVFRQMVLANYDGKCALTGIDIPELLVASHIIPWAENEKERLNPENGICLSSLYDKAFDMGLISFDDSFRTIFSSRLASNVGKDYYERYFSPVFGKTLAETKRYAVNSKFLEWHRQMVFKR